MDKNYTSKELFDWFKDKQVSAFQMRRSMQHVAKMQRFSETLGKMYFFYYDPKHKLTLPIYDRFPLVFPIEKYSNGFLGLNVHYLPMPARKALFSQLLNFATASNLTPRTKLTLTYRLMQQTKALASLGQPCIKRYLDSHITSWLIEVPAPEWDRALQLPVESFVRKK